MATNDSISTGSNNTTAYHGNLNYNDNDTQVAAGVKK